MWRTSAEPPPAALSLHLYRLRKGAVFSVVCLSERIYGIVTHWTGTRTEPCIDPPDECPGCKARKPRRWKGYIHCRNAKDGAEGLIELTAGAARQLQAQRPNTPTLRGTMLRIERSKKASNGRLDVQVLGTYHPIEDLPPAQSPIHTLELLFTTAAVARPPEDRVQSTRL